MTRYDPIASTSRSTDVNRLADRGILSQLITSVVVAGGTLTMVPTAAAHEGSVHASTPHWTLLAVAVGGLGIVGGSVFLGRTVWTDRPQRTVAGLLIGLVVTMVGTIGLTQIQVEPIGTTPVGRDWFPLIAGVGGFGILTASFVLGMRRWPERPRYSILGILLGLWVMYPVLVPGSGYMHPLGYFIVAVVPLAVGYILWTDVRSALTQEVIDPLAQRVSVVVAMLVTVFLLFSAGLFTVNPDEGVNVPMRAFVTVAEFADPLVVWPAIEFYLPWIPLAGAMSVGTILLIGLLVGLVGVNTMLTTTVWQRDLAMESSGGVLGAIATTGATACCCCGPAVYAIASAILGVSASPLYWAFIDPSSPVGALFFVGAVVLLTGSSIQLASALAEPDVCKLSN